MRGILAVAGSGPARPVLPPVIGTLLVAGGLALLGWLGWESLRPDPAPYHYQVVAEGELDVFPELGIKAPGDLRIRKYELHARDVDVPVAVIHAGRRGEGPEVPLGWRSLVSEPILSLGAPAQELGALARAVTTHIPSDALVLAWWDVSRQLALLSGADVIFDEYLGQPLLVPEPWSSRRALVEGLEKKQWSSAGATSTREVFDQYIDALLADPARGTLELRRLAGTRQTFLVLHLTDAYRLGVLRPRQLGVGFKDFPRIGDTHRMISGVKAWLKQQGYRSYTVDPGIKDSTRVYFLTDSESADTLLAHALPFNTSEPSHIPSLSLVYQRGGFWVYRLDPEEMARSDPL